MYRHASEAGFALPPGTDINLPYAGGNLRGHLSEIADQTKVRGHVLLCPGFTEFCEKYADVMQAFNERGYNVLAIDWPGQGMSGHLGRHHMAVHCDSFDQHISAMDRLIAAVGWQDRPLILFGHSMGGHLALRLCQHLGVQIGNEVKVAIILSPMIAPPVMPVWMVRIITYALAGAGFGRFYLPFSKPSSLDHIRQFRPHNALSRDKHGYESQFVWFDDNAELRRSQPTAGWVRAAYESCARTTLNKLWMAKISCPVLALLAGDERVVHKASSDRMLPCLPRLSQHEYDGARHELLNETPDVVADIWKRVDAFLGDEV